LPIKKTENNQKPPLAANQNHLHSKWIICWCFEIGNWWGNYYIKR